MEAVRIKRSRKRAPNETEWERIKPHLERLYIAENLPLKIVSTILEQEHNFDAAWVSRISVLAPLTCKGQPCANSGSKGGT